MFLFFIAAKITFDRVNKRRRSEFCSRYNKGFKTHEPLYYYRFYDPTILPEYPWSKPNPSNECTPPKYNKSIDDELGLKTSNFLRWATGYENEIVIDDKYHDEQCQCALYLHHANTLTHFPSSSGKCYTKGASTGCMTSNLARHYPSSAAAVSAYYWDTGIIGVGHRSHLLKETLHKTSFCGVGIYSAMRVMQMDNEEKIKFGDSNFLFISTPPPGPIELTMLVDTWSLKTNTSCKNPKITMKQNGTTIPVSNEFSTEYFQTWEPNITLAYNTKYSAEIDCGENVYFYESYTTNCSMEISDIEFDKTLNRKSAGIYWQNAVNYTIIALFIGAIIGIILCIVYKKTGFKFNTKSSEEKTPKKSTLNKFIV